MEIAKKFIFVARYLARLNRKPSQIEITNSPIEKIYSLRSPLTKQLTQNNNTPHIYKIKKLQQNDHSESSKMRIKSSIDAG